MESMLGNSSFVDQRQVGLNPDSTFEPFDLSVPEKEDKAVKGKETEKEEMVANSSVKQPTLTCECFGAVRGFAHLLSWSTEWQDKSCRLRTVGVIGENWRGSFSSDSSAYIL